MISNFMGTGTAPTVNAANASVGVEDDISGLGNSRNNRNNNRRQDQGGRMTKVARQLFRGLFGGGGTKTTVATESMVSATAGVGATEGLPTCADDGSIEMVFLQVSHEREP
jgi:hypothetical protein